MPGVISSRASCLQAQSTPGAGTDGEARTRLHVPVALRLGAAEPSTREKATAEASEFLTFHTLPPRAGGQLGTSRPGTDPFPRGLTGRGLRTLPPRWRWLHAHVYLTTRSVRGRHRRDEPFDNSLRPRNRCTREQRLGAAAGGFLAGKSHPGMHFSLSQLSLPSWPPAHQGAVRPFSATLGFPTSSILSLPLPTI